MPHAEFAAVIVSQPSGMKALLMNQQRLAGTGNMYSDEILFQAGVLPKRSSDALRDDQIERVHRVMCEVLDAAIRAQAKPRNMPDDWLISARRRDDEAFLICGGELRTETVGGRTARWCPACQS
jgi:formamidopyrimidine-DNA glycosylase